MTTAATADIFPALKASCAADWDAYVHQRFVRDMGAGTLPEEAFRWYLAQDYLFLIHFSRAWALAAVKAERLDEMRHAVATVNALIGHEMQLHVEYCAGWGLDEDIMAALPEAAANIAYTRYVLDRGHSGDLLDLLVALAPCVIGYAEIGAWMARPEHAAGWQGNPYRPWMEMYSGGEYQQVAADVQALIARVAARRIGADPQGSGRWPSLAATFAAATRLEVGFWEMACHPQPLSPPPAAAT